MTITEYEEKVTKDKDAVQIDSALFYQLMSDISLITQMSEVCCMCDDIPNENARNGYIKARDRVNDFVSMYLKNEGVTE